MNKAAATSKTPAGIHIPIAILAPVDNPVDLPPPLDESVVIVVVLVAELLVVDIAVFWSKNIGSAWNVAVISELDPMVPSKLSMVPVVQLPLLAKPRLRYFPKDNSCLVQYTFCKAYPLTEVSVNVFHPWFLFLPRLTSAPSAFLILHVLGLRTVALTRGSTRSGYHRFS